MFLKNALQVACIGFPPDARLEGTEAFPYIAECECSWPFGRKCEFALNAKPVPRACPKCGAPYLLEKQTKREGHIEACNNPECGYKAPITTPEETRAPAV